MKDVVYFSIGRVVDDEVGIYSHGDGWDFTITQAGQRFIDYGGVEAANKLREQADKCIDHMLENSRRANEQANEEETP